MAEWIVEIKGKERIGKGQLVRCKDCRKHDTYDCHITWETTQKTPDDWFCADGEPKDGDGE